MKFCLFFILSFATVGCLSSCESDKKASVQTIILINPSSIDLKDKAMVVTRKELIVPAGDLYPLLINQSGDTIPSQMDYLDKDDTWDELFFVLNLSANQTDTIHLKWLEAAVQYPNRTSVHFGVRQTVNSTIKPAYTDTFYADQLPGVIGYQHYQTDGPAWENDKVGFRQYLDGRNSIDVFGKKVPYMTPEDVGIGKDGVTENNYSEMKDWGTDILAVANSAGIGGFSLLINDSLPRLGITEQDKLNNVDSTIFNIITEGPVRSMMKFRYINWKPLGRNYLVEQTTSIWPGTYAYNNSVRFNNLKGDETMVVGLVNSNTSEKLTEIDVNDQWVVLFTHDKQSVNKEWWLGLALILPKKDYLGYTEAPKKGRLSTTYLGKLKVVNNKPVNYFAVACWELSDKGFSDPVYFKKYLVDLVNQLTEVVKLKIE
ncbi:MAG: DUF4861 domain-containing protein [Chitinophagaceae bacterium]